jgi:hypothetical protein
MSIWRDHSGEACLPLNFKIAGGFAITATLAEFTRHPSPNPADIHDVLPAAVRADALHLGLIKNDLEILAGMIRWFFAKILCVS